MKVHLKYQRGCFYVIDVDEDDLKTIIRFNGEYYIFSDAGCRTSDGKWRVTYELAECHEVEGTSVLLNLMKKSEQAYLMSP